MNSLFNSWITQNTIVVLLLLLILTAFVKMRKSEYWRRAWEEIRRRKIAMVCLAIISIYLAIAILDSIGWRSPIKDRETGQLVIDKETGNPVLDSGMSIFDRLATPLRLNKEITYSAPMASCQYTATVTVNDQGVPQRIHSELSHPKKHIFGTDLVGMDVLYLALKSIRTGMILGLLTTLIAIPFAMLMGICAGYFGGWIDDIIQYIYSVISSIPTVLFIAAFIVIFGSGLFQLCLAMGLASWTGLCRLLRAETLKLRETEFVQASRAIGTPSWKILFRHICPNVVHIIVITMVLRFSTEVLTEAVLTYLGIGVGATTISWGSMINDARSELTRDPVIWWKLTAAFVFMVGLVLPANLFGDAVRDALDPRLKH